MFFTEKPTSAKLLVLQNTPDKRDSRIKYAEKAAAITKLAAINAIFALRVNGGWSTKTDVGRTVSDSTSKRIVDSAMCFRLSDCHLHILW